MNKVRESLDFFKSNRVLDSSTKRILVMNDKAGIRLNKSIDSLQIETGGPDNVPYLPRDCRNYLDKVRHLQLTEGDAEAMNQYFMRMQADNRDFFYAVDLNEDGRLRNVFSADAGSREIRNNSLVNVATTQDSVLNVNNYANMGPLMWPNMGPLMWPNMMAHNFQNPPNLMPTMQSAIRGGPQGWGTPHSSLMGSQLQEWQGVQPSFLGMMNGKNNKKE